MLKLIDQPLFNSLCRTAAAATRKRAHFTLHLELTDAVQRLCVAIEPGSYIRPHRHAEQGKWEFFVILQGAAVILLFDQNGMVTKRITLDSNGPVHGAEIAENCWHTLAALAKDTVLLEIKPGPYQPLAAADFASWAPAEGTPEALLFENFFRINAYPQIWAPLIPGGDES